MSKDDMRWLQRLSNYEKALNELGEEVLSSSQKEFSKLERKGVVQSFEIVHELAWKVIKDFFAVQGEKSIYGSRDAFQIAFKNGIIKQGKCFMESIKSRNLTSHIYDEKISEEIFNDIVNKYYDAFEELKTSMLKEKETRGL